MDTADIVEEKGFKVVEAPKVDDAYRFFADYQSLRLVISDTQILGLFDG